MNSQNDGSKNDVRRPIGARLLVVLTLSAAVLTTLALWQAPRAKARDAGAMTTFGPAKTVGDGTARAYLTLENGLPREIGVELSESALRALPAHAPAHAGHHMMAEHILELPPQAKTTPFKFVELDWNPLGHEPDGVYNRPHFDFHFFTITKAERDAIDPADPHYTRKAETLPGADLIPAGYFLPRPILPFPRMGVHWVASQAEEFTGRPFTHTFIHGSWDGRMIFYEPMITKAFLESKSNVTLPIATAARYEPSGYHPTKYNVRYDSGARAYRVSLSGFAFRGSAVLDTRLQ
jgi:hypothetical protein